MRTATILLACASVALSGCITRAITRMTPDQQIGLVNAFAAAGCKGTIDIEFGAQTAAGVSPGAVGGSFELTGQCDPANAKAPVVVSIKDLGKPGTGTAAQ